ncbi:MAG: hypothetical protein ACK4WB_04545, partial [Desulfatiglandales bacterium]
LSDMERVRAEVLEGLRGKGEIDISRMVEEETKIKLKNRELSLSQRLCYRCPKEKSCHLKERDQMSALIHTLEEFKESLGLQKEEMWVSFQRHLQFLKETGFVDQNNRLTPDGFWASKLRLDYPLLIAELIRKEIIKGLSPELLGAALAPFVWDRAHEVFIRVKGRLNISEYESLYERILEELLALLDRLEANRFPIPQIPFWPGVATYAWAKGVSWPELMSMVKADEGDVANLIIRTIDHLRQLTGLKETHPDLASAAEKAIELLMREPVYPEEAP